MCFILTNMITPYRLCNTCLGYTAHKSCGVVPTCTAPRPDFISITPLLQILLHKFKYSACGNTFKFSTNMAPEKRIIFFWTYHTSYTDVDLDHSFTGNNFKFKYGARGEQVSRDRRSGGSTNWWGYSYSWRKLYLPSNISQGKDSFPLHLPLSPYSLLATILTLKHSNIIFPSKREVSLHISLLLPHSSYSLLATILHFKHNDKIFPHAGKFHRENFTARGKFSLLTVGNTDKCKYGAGGDAVTWPGKWRG